MSSLLKPRPQKKAEEAEKKAAEAKAAEAKAAEAAAAEDLPFFLNKLETNVVPSLQSELQTIFTNQELQTIFTDIEFIYKDISETDEAFITKVNTLIKRNSYLINPGVKSDTSIKRKLAILGYKETDYKNLYDLVRFTVIFPSENFYKNMYDFIIKINTFHKLDYLKDYMDHTHLNLSITENFYWGVNARFKISSEIKLFEIQFHTHETFKYKNENHNYYKTLQNAKAKLQKITMKAEVSKKPPKILPDNPICFLKMNEFYNSRDYQFNVKKLNVTLQLNEIKPNKQGDIEIESLTSCQLVGGFNFQNSEHIKVSNIYKRLSKLLGTNNLIAGSEMRLVGEDNQFIKTQPTLELDKCKIVNSTFGTGFLEKISSVEHDMDKGEAITPIYSGKYYKPTKNTLYNYKGIFILNVHFNGGGPKEAYKKTSTSHIGEKSFKYDTTHNKVTKGEDITLGTPDDFLFKSIYEESEKIEFGKEFGNELNEITNFLIYELFPYIDKEINIICGDTNITMSKLRSEHISRDKIGKIIAIALGKIFGGKWLVMMSPIKVQKKREGFFIRNHQINKSTKVGTKTAEEDGSIIAFKKYEDKELISFENDGTFVFYSSNSKLSTPITPITETIEALEFKFGVDNALDTTGKPQDKVFIDHPILYYPLDVILNYYGKTTTPDKSFLIVVNMGSIINAGEKDWHTDDIYYKEDDDGYYIKDTNEISVEFSRVDKIKKFDELVYKYFKSIINNNVANAIYESLLDLPEYNMINGFSDIFIVINEEGFIKFKTDFEKTLKKYMLISMEKTKGWKKLDTRKTELLISHDDIKGAILKKTQPVALKGGSKLRIKLKKTKRKKGKKTKKKKVRCKKSKKKSR